MTIYLDISAAVHSHAGLGRYAETLGHTLVKEHESEIAFFYYTDPLARPPKTLASFPQRTVDAGTKRWRLQVWLGQVFRQSFDHYLPGARLYHATEHLLMPLRGIPTVLTIHDLLFKRFPRYHKRQNYYFLNLAMPLFCRRADAIIAVSEWTRRDLIETYGVPPAKITVIHEAAAPHFVPQSDEAIARARARCALPERYLMTLCAIEPRKNHLGFLRAFEQLSRDDPDLYWVIGGSRGWLYEDFLAALESSPARGRVILTGYVEDEDLPGVYAGALAFVFPSFGEGFGLDPLEAMACSTPVVCSNATSLPEIGGDAARYFDPFDTEQMIATLRSVLADDDMRAEMREKGLARAAQFSWSRAAKETWALYQKLL